MNDQALDKLKAEPAITDTVMADPDQYRFTICFCTRSRPRDLERALRSLTRSTRPIAQVIVSDDSVDEETAQLVAAQFPDVVYVKGPRRGLGANRNCAVAFATGTHVVYMDDDTALGERFIESIVDHYKAIEPSLRAKTIVSGLENQNGKLIEPSDLSFWGFVDQPRTSETTRPLHTAVINATSFPRPLFPLISFDENLIYGCEEVDICTQAIAKGYRFELCRKAVNDHFHSPLHRKDYARFTTASRIYTTLKRHFYLQRSPGKGLLYLFLGPLKLAQSEVRRKGLTGLVQVFQSVSIAAGYSYRHYKLVTGSKGSAGRA
jgi:glycosyltransferase involved in cell wall biosynthesis